MKALEINGNNPQLHVNIGITYRNMGKLDDAISHYTLALGIKPDYASAYNNLANVLVDKGDLDSGIKNYNRALQIQPKDSDTYVNLGVAYHHSDQIDKALECYKKAINFEPHHNQAYWNLEKALHNIRFKKHDPNLATIICELINKDRFFAPVEIVKPSISLLKLDPIYQDLLLLAKPPMNQKKIREILKKFSKMPLFLGLLKTCTIPDLEIESILKYVRRSVLLEIENLVEEIETFEFLSALSTQCFINEYIYGQNSKEDEKLYNLEKDLELNLPEGQKPCCLKILVLACFKPLSEYSWISYVQNIDELRSIITLQLWNHKKEKENFNRLQTLKTVSDKISSQVQLQYENNPYPRWLHTRLERHLLQ